MSSSSWSAQKRNRFWLPNWLGGSSNTHNSPPSSSGKRKNATFSPELTDIERMRQDNINRNAEFLRSLGMSETLQDIRRDEEEKGKKTKGETSCKSNEKKRVKEVKTAPLPTYEDVLGKWIGREDQIKLLVRLLPSPPNENQLGFHSSSSSPHSSTLLIHGPSGTGKTGVMKDLLTALQLPHAYIRAVEHPNSRSLYTTIAASWIKYLETHAEKTGMEGLGYLVEEERDGYLDHMMRSREDVENDRKSSANGDEYISTGGKKRARKESIIEEDDHNDDDDNNNGGDEEEGTNDDERSMEDGDEVEEDEEDLLYVDYEADAYWSQMVPRDSSTDQVTPLATRCRTAGALLHLLRLWRPPPQDQQKKKDEEEGRRSLRPATERRGKVPFIIVLDGADRLPRASAHVRHELLELPSILASPRGGGESSTSATASVSLTVVLISESPTVALGSLEAAQTLNVFFPAYTKAQASAILLRSLQVAAGIMPPSKSQDTDGRQQTQEGKEDDGGSTKDIQNRFQALMQDFVNLLVASLYSSTRDVREMRRISALLSEKYLGPLMDNDNDNTSLSSSFSSSTLYEGIRPLLQRAVHSCLHMPAEPLDHPNTSTPTVPSFVRPPSSSSSSSSGSSSTMVATKHEALLRYELPKLARFLVVASFLASRIPPETDLYLFTKTNRGRRRSRREAAGQERLAEEKEAVAETEGARSFSLERLLSIFTCLVSLYRSNNADYANSSTGTAELFAQINSLVHFRLLTRVKSNVSELGSIRYKCNVGPELVFLAAQELEIGLNDFLEAGRAAAGMSRSSSSYRS